MMLVNHFIPNTNERFGTENVNASYSQHKTLFIDMKRTHNTKADTFGPMVTVTPPYPGSEI